MSYTQICHHLYRSAIISHLFPPQTPSTQPQPDDCWRLGVARLQRRRRLDPLHASGGTGEPNQQLFRCSSAVAGGWGTAVLKT